MRISRVRQGLPTWGYLQFYRAYVRVGKIPAKDTEIYPLLKGILIDWQNFHNDFSSKGKDMDIFRSEKNFPRFFCGRKMCPGPGVPVFFVKIANPIKR